MPSPIPTFARILTTLHRDQDGCDGPVEAVRQRGWRFWKYDFVCKECGEDVTPKMSCPFTGKGCLPSCRLFDGGNCLYEGATRGAIKSEEKFDEMMKSGGPPLPGPETPYTRTFTPEDLPPEVAIMLKAILEKLRESEDDYHP